jgi:hypothetical protein
VSPDPLATTLVSSPDSITTSAITIAGSVRITTV